MKEIDFINAKMNGLDAPVPPYLYKYRPFDGYAIDMLEKEYVYLCPAERLDDPSECKVDFSVQDIIDLKTNRLTVKGVDMILSSVRPHTSEYNYRLVRDIVARTLGRDGSVRRNFLLDASFEIQELVPGVNIAPLINELGTIPERLNDPKIRSQFEKLFVLAHDARKNMGICSLSELKNSDEMWRNYADDSKGYCIEYEMLEYKNAYALFPVVYQDNRETNIVANILGSFIGQMIIGISNGQIATDRSQYIRLFLTKDLIWAYQKEWRLLGDAKERLRAPSIHAVYLGKNMSEQNKEQVIHFCEKHGIPFE